MFKALKKWWKYLGAKFNRSFEKNADPAVQLEQALRLEGLFDGKRISQLRQHGAQFGVRVANQPCQGTQGQAQGGGWFTKHGAAP